MYVLSAVSGSGSLFVGPVEMAPNMTLCSPDVVLTKGPLGLAYYHASLVQIHSLDGVDLSQLRVIT